jgi:lipid-A-disaccharide synthase
MGRRIFITAAEVSGDKHAAQLVRSLKQLDPELSIEGLGGPEMADAGAVIHHNTVTNAAMGLRGLLRTFEIYDCIKWTRRYFDQQRPDLLIGVDSPSMNFHFARVAHDRGIPVLQFVAPQLWAWMPRRMKKLRRWVDRVACILPFEERFFQSHGVNATFVGHPLFDQLPADRFHCDYPRFPQRPPVIGILTGSRRSEAEHNFPRLFEVAQRIQKEFPEASFLIPTTAATHPIVTKILSEEPDKGGRTDVGQDRFDEMVPRCDLCLTVSGTATLHVAGYGVPMIVVYWINPVQWNLGGRFLVPTRTFALVNILASGGRTDRAANRLVPEFVPWYGPIDPVANTALDLLRKPQKLEAQREALRRLVSELDQPGASLRTAKLALEMIPANHRFTPAPPSPGNGP